MLEVVGTLVEAVDRLRWFDRVQAGATPGLKGEGDGPLKAGRGSPLADLRVTGLATRAEPPRMPGQLRKGRTTLPQRSPGPQTHTLPWSCPVSMRTRFTIPGP